MKKLYHFTNKPNLKKISVKYFGGNSYSKNESQASSVKRSFFYTEPRICESALQGAEYCYIAITDEKKLYPIQTDPKKYLSKYSTITEALKAISRRYNGIIYQYNNYKIVSLFKDISCKKYLA